MRTTVDIARIVTAVAAGLVLGLSALAPVVRADTITTTSQQTFTGKIASEAADKVVISTDSGNVTIPRAAIGSIEKGDATGGVVVPTKIAPADAPKVFEEAKAAIAKGSWTQAAARLEGLMELTPAAFPHENRMAATAALVTCYLQVKDAANAARAFSRRADLVADDGDKRRLRAAVEAFDQCRGTVIDNKSVMSYEEAMAAAMEWKSAQLVADVKKGCAKAGGLNDPDKLEAAGKRAQDRLNEADLYTPGVSALKRREVMTALVENILQVARRTVDKCTTDRKDLSRMWRTSALNVHWAANYNTQVNRYHAIRKAAAEGLKNLKGFAAGVQVPELYAEREKECTALLTQLEELEWHLVLPGVPRQLIAERRPGSSVRG
jgi:hypothetical protein